MKRSNLLTTIGGIMALFASIPVALGMAHVAMPGWFYATCVTLGVLGPGIVGLAAKGQDEHSTDVQVQQATEVKKVEQEKP
jgi:hypothetical protein